MWRINLIAQLQNTENPNLSQASNKQQKDFQVIQEEEDLIQIKEIKKTDYSQEDFTSERETPFLDQVFESSINYLDDLELISNDFDERKTTFPDLTDSREYALEVMTGGGDFSMGGLFSEIEDADYWAFKFFASHRQEILALTKDLPHFENSARTELDLEWVLQKDWEKHQFFIDQQVLFLGLQRFLGADNYQIQLYTGSVGYEGLFSFQSFFLKSYSRLFYGRQGWDREIVKNNSEQLEINHFMGIENHIGFYFKNHLSGLIVDLIYQGDQSLNQSGYRHWGSLGVGYQFRWDQETLDLYLGSLISYENKLSVAKFDYFDPFVFFARAYFLKEFSKVAVGFGVKLDYRIDSYDEFYWQQITVQVDEIPQSYRYARGYSDIDLKIDSWFHWRIQFLFDYFLRFDRIELNSIEQKKVVELSGVWATGFDSNLKMTWDWFVISSDWNYRYASESGLYPMLETQNEIHFLIHLIYSDLFFQHEWSWNNFLLRAAGNNRLKLDRQVMTIGYDVNLPSQLSFQLRLKNLLNSDYYENGSYMRGIKRNLYFGIRYLF